MSKRTGVVLFLLLAAVFLFLNRAAYHGFFQDDDFESLSWVRWGPATEYLRSTLSPIYEFRSVGFFYYHAAEQVFGTDYSKYVAVIHTFHLLNIWILWLLVRRLGASPVAAGAACVLFALHMAFFDIFWKPMFVFDLLCTTFCLLSLLLWSRGNWILSFFSFWLAFKTKELAVMLPFVLLCYEAWFGKRRWLRLAPFVAVSCWFALQALVLKPTQATAYTLHFTWEALSQTAPFYAQQVFLVPYLGFLLPIAAFTAPNRRTWFGLALLGLFFIPLVFLPGRVFSAYCYLPFTGFAIAVAGMMEARRPAIAALFFLLCAPLDVRTLRNQRDDALREAQDAREWITTLRAYARQNPSVAGFVYAGRPEAFHIWGMEGAVKYYFRRLDGTIPPIDTAAAEEMKRAGHVAILNWDARTHKLYIQTLA